MTTATETGTKVIARACGDMWCVEIQTPAMGSGAAFHSWYPCPAEAIEVAEAISRKRGFALDVQC